MSHGKNKFEHLRPEVKALYVRYIGELNRLFDVVSPDERMIEWKTIFNKYKELDQLSEQTKKNLVDVTESLIKAKFSTTSLQVLEGVACDLNVHENFSLPAFADKLKETLFDDTMNGLDFTKLEKLAKVKYINFTPNKPYWAALNLNYNLADYIQSSTAKSRQRRPKDPEAAKVKPANVVNNKDDIEDDQIAVVRNALHKCYLKNGKKPINIYKFGIDPVSFTHTVENMFYLAFLIKENLAKLTKVGPHLMVEPSEKNSENPSGISLDRNNLDYCSQNMIPVDHENWRILIQYLNIKESAIKWNS